MPVMLMKDAWDNEEGGTNSECEQLMRREIPLAFEDYIRPVQVGKWMDNLASAKMFIDTEGRMPSESLMKDARDNELQTSKIRKEEPTVNVSS